MRQQTAVKAPGLLPCYIPALAVGSLLLSYNAAVPRICNWSCTVLVWGAVEPRGSTPAFLHGLTAQQAPEPFQPPVHLTWRHLLCCTPLRSPCPVGKPLCLKLSTEGLSLYQMRKYLTGSYLIKLFISLSLALQGILKDQFLLLLVTLFAYISLRNTHCSLCVCFCLFLVLHIPAYFHHSPGLP